MRLWYSKNYCFSLAHVVPRKRSISHNSRERFIEYCWNIRNRYRYPVYEWWMEIRYNVIECVRKKPFIHEWIAFIGREGTTRIPYLPCILVLSISFDFIVSFIVDFKCSEWKVFGVGKVFENMKNTLEDRFGKKERHTYVLKSYLNNLYSMLFLIFLLYLFKIRCGVHWFEHI